MIDRLLDQLWNEEGYRDVLYDDKTGKPLKIGDIIQGNPTIAVGWNTIGKPISKERARVILSWFVQDAIDDLQKALPWVISLPEDTQLALQDMSFNLGIQTLLLFTTFLSMLKAGNYKGAADDLMTTKWSKQVGNRAIFLSNLIRNS